MLILILIGFLLLFWNLETEKIISKLLKSLFLTLMGLFPSLLFTRLSGMTLLPLFTHWKTWLLSPLVTLISFVIIIGLEILYIRSLQKGVRHHDLYLKELTKGDYFFFYFSFLFIFIGVLLPFSSYWGMGHFGNLSIDQIIYHLTEPLAGSDSTQIYAFIEIPLLNTLTATFLLAEVFNFFLHYRFTNPYQAHGKEPKTYPRLKKLAIVSLSLLFLVSGSFISLKRIGFTQVKAYFFESSTLYEDHYVDPKPINVTFPKEKRNLIYIFLESVETTYLSKDVGGAQEENLMPHLTELAENDGLNFSNTNLLGGAQQVPGVGFTAGAMAGQSSGAPVITSIDYNEYGTADYLPGAYSLGEFLEKEGYNQTLLLGSEGSFGGRDKYFTQHGNYNIVDYNTAIDEGWIPADYRVWWGYEDEKLFSFAKEQLTELSQEDEPFNFTFLTADTHFEDGYATDKTPNLFDDQYSNVIHYSDEMLYEFLSWVKEQPFYDNTTIVISGDHLSMDADFFNDLPADYTRTVFNLFLNSPVTPVENKNRDFSTLDMYPTTLAALGATIPGERLGLGTNLFSNTPTLMEDYGFAKLTTEMSKGSKYYSQKIMKDSEATAKEILENTSESTN